MSCQVMTDQVRLGQVSSDQVRLGQIKSCQVMTGQVRSGQVRSGQVSLGQVRVGQVRSGQFRSGQSRSGQVRSGQVRSGQVRSGQVKLGQVSEVQGRMRNDQCRRGKGRLTVLPSAQDLVYVPIGLDSDLIRHFLFLSELERRSSEVLSVHATCRRGRERMVGVEDRRDGRLRQRVSGGREGYGIGGYVLVGGMEE